MLADSAVGLLVWRIQMTHFQGPSARGISDAAVRACGEMNAR